MEESAADVEARAARPLEQGGGGEVDGDSRSGEHQHEPALDVGRRDEPPHRLEDDPDPYERKRDPVREGRQDLDAAEAEGPAASGRALRDRRRDERKRQSSSIGEHVPRVREQGERAGDDADDELRD